jgi:hypothetical protein
MKRPKYRIRKESIYFKCMSCEEGLHSMDNTDWVMDDGYSGICASCMELQDDDVKSHAAIIEGN